MQRCVGCSPAPLWHSIATAIAARSSRAAHKPAFTRRCPSARSSKLSARRQPAMQCNGPGTAPDTPPKRAVIIGAGFAGLAAARRLASHEAGSWNAVVLEGSDRVGGRAHTVELPGCGRVEMGATWLHGLKGNPLYAYAVEKGIMSAQATQRENEWGSVQWVREGEDEALVSDRAKAAQTASGAYSRAVEDGLENREPGATVGQHLCESWPQACSRFSQQHQQLAAETWSWREKLQRSMDGCRTTGDMLTAGLAVYDELDGLNVPVPGGFQGLAISMGEGLDIRFGSVVEAVEWGGEVGARVVCSSGETYDADAVIVTISLGVLKASHASLFSPPLPARKAQAIARMGMGCIDKIFVASAAPQPQPTSVAGAFNLLWRVSDAAAADAFLGEQPCDEQSCSGSEGSSPNWQRGAYAIRFKGSEFVTTKALASGGGGSSGGGAMPGSNRYSGAGLADVSAAAHPPKPTGPEAVHQYAATAWIAGPEALAMEARNQTQLEADVRELLAAFPPVQQWLPEVTAVFRSRWGTSPLTRGSYSYPAAGSSLADLHLLAEPLSNEAAAPVVLFAGEATHGSHYGTAHGAFLSGEREADRLLGCLE